MSTFKVGDEVATVFSPWQKAIVTKVKPDKLKLAVSTHYGILAYFFPIIYLTIPTRFVIEYKEPTIGCAPAGKPPVSDPNEEGDKPL